MKETDEEFTDRMNTPKKHILNCSDKLMWEVYDFLADKYGKNREIWSIRVE